MNNEKSNVGASIARPIRETQRGITLIALIITIIVMLILAGVVLSLTIGERGIFKTAKGAAEKMEEAEAREKLELVLLDLQTDKLTDVNYNENEYINTKIQANEMIVNGDIVFVNGWQFQIDRSVPEIVANLGKGQPEAQIGITMTSTTSSDYVKATINIEIAYEKEIVSISLNGESIEIPEKQEGKYIIEKDVINNGTYSVIAKDTEDKYNMKSIKISDITENMDIYTTGDLVKFRDMVNSGRTFEGRTVCLMNDLDLSGVCGENIGNWTPIGRLINEEEMPFKGKFNGNKHTVSKLYINNSESTQGLFAYIQNAQISGIIIDNATVIGNDMIGGIIAISDGSTIISDCHVKGNSDIQATGSNQTGTYVGGILSCGNANINNCSNEATITAVTSVYAGGIAGVCSGTIDSCYNNGTIDGKSSAGIVGCDGGVLLVNNCYNTGNVLGASNIGGIVGYSMNLTGYSVSITNCYNIGKINTTASYDGAIIGNDKYKVVLISNNYWTSSSETSYGRGYKSSNSGAEKVDESTLKGYASVLGDEFWTTDTKNINNGYPILKWQLEE